MPSDPTPDDLTLDSYTLDAYRRRVSTGATLSNVGCSRLLDAIEALTAERDVLSERNAALEAIAGEEATFRELETKMRDGTVDLRAVWGEEGGHPAARFIAALLLNIVLGDGDEPEEPPNYRSAELSMKPAGEFQPFRAFLEVVKPDGKSSHELRREVEAERDAALAEVVKLREAAAVVAGPLLEHWAECPASPDAGCDDCHEWFRARAALAGSDTEAAPYLGTVSGYQTEKAERAERHMHHYATCWCLGDSDRCCDPSCCATEEAANNP